MPPHRPLDRFAALALLASAVACAGSGKPYDASRTDSLRFGHPDSVLTWTAAERRAGFPRYHRIFPVRAIPASSAPSRLPAVSDAGLSSVDVDGFMRRDSVIGLMVVQDGKVVLERYGEGHGPSVPWVSYSVAKSVVSMLVGAAIQDGWIGSVEDPITDYVPLLHGSAYDGVTIRDVLRMSSGVAWNEDYADPSSDVSREIHYGAVERLRFLGDRERTAPPGERFNYSTGEIFLAGTVVRNAVGNNLATYLHQRLWEPFGMEADASWMLVEPGGPEYAGCCISATLRDYARIGLFALSDGVLDDGSRVLPEGWMAQATRGSTSNPDYGYLWWLHEDGSFSARGIFGQLIHVDPALNLVVAMHGLWPEPVSEARSVRRAAFLERLKDRLR